MKAVFIPLRLLLLHVTIKYITWSIATARPLIVKCPVFAQLWKSPIAGEVDGWQIPQNVSLCDRCSASVLRCKRMLGWTDSPCGYFTSDTAPPILLSFFLRSPTAPLTCQRVELQASRTRLRYYLQLQHGLEGPAKASCQKNLLVFCLFTEKCIQNWATMASHTRTHPLSIGTFIIQINQDAGNEAIQCNVCQLEWNCPLI